MIAPALNSHLKAEVLADPKCSHCGGEPADLGVFYRELGEEAAKALYDGTPGNFWGAIEDFAIENALRKGKVRRTVQTYC